MLFLDIVLFLEVRLAALVIEVTDDLEMPLTALRADLSVVSPIPSPTLAGGGEQLSLPGLELISLGLLEALQPPCKTLEICLLNLLFSAFSLR